MMKNRRRMIPCIPAAGFFRRAAAGMLLFLILTFAAGYATFAQDAFGPVSRVLVLFSYTPVWKVERDVLKGLEETISPLVTMDLVCMDAKNLDTASAEKITSQHVSCLKAKEQYDAVIAVDDDALEYIMKYRQSEFEKVPVIFCNINSRERAELAAKDPLMTGIYETFFGNETVEAALKLYPEAKRVVGICDHTLTGLAQERLFGEIDAGKDLEYELLDMMELSRDEIREKISSCGEDTILLFLDFAKDKDGNLYGLKEACEFLSSCTDTPLLTADLATIGLGTLGGCGGSYEEAGVRTARILEQILDGADMTDMGLEEMEGRYCFDAALLKRYGIRESDLPAGTILINDREHFWEKYASLLRPVLVVIMLLVVIVVLLVADRRRLGTLVKSQKKLSDAEIRRRKAESQSSAVGKFLSSVSHDLRTPLVSVIGYTEIALEETDEEKRTGYLRKIRSSAELLTGLVNDTLDVSRIISGKVKFHPELTTFDQIADSVVTSVSETARKKRVRFSSEIQDGDVTIRADIMRLQRIILNLLSNAVKFTPETGQVTLKIEHLPERVKGCNFRILVRDTGIGMSREFQKIMFEPFVQEHPDPLHMGTQDGTGLGLTIVRNNVEQMGGFLEINSEEGKGTEIAAFLPVDVPERKKEEALQEKRDYSRLAGMHILVAEDSDMNTEVVRTILSRMNISCDCVSDGQEAVEFFENAPPGTYDVILMDLRMPVMNGYKAAAGIRSLDHPDAASVPILALSADVYQEDVKRAKDAGMTGHIGKPIRPETLYDALTDLKIR